MDGLLDLFTSDSAVDADAYPEMPFPPPLDLASLSPTVPIGSGSRPGQTPSTVPSGDDMFGMNTFSFDEVSFCVHLCSPC